LRSRDTVTVGWIDPGVVDGMFALSVAAIYREHAGRVRELARVEGGGLLSRQRNELVTRFLAGSSDWLLMLDSDQQLSTDGFERLCQAGHAEERPIVAGLYFAAWTGDGLYPDPIPLIFREIPGRVGFTPITDYPDNKVIPVDGAGTGCLLIHRGVFEKFREHASEHEGPDWCWFHDMPVGGLWLSEDHYFCKKARQLGYTIHAHTGVVLPHRKRYWLTDQHFRGRT